MVLISISAKRRMSCWLGLVVAVTFAGIVEARAQQVLVCSSLRDDLVNFDRRASSVGTGGAHTPDTSPNAIVNLFDAKILSCSAPILASGDCHPDHPEAPRHPLSARVIADPVRLRLIELMRHYHCEPLAVYASGPFDASITSVETETTVRAKY